MTPGFLQSAPGSDPVLIEGHFRASPQRVFDAWTNPDELKQWFGSTTTALEVYVDCRVGGQWEIVFQADNNGRDVLSGQYLEIEPGQFLSFSWMHQSIDQQGQASTSAESRVSITFQAAGEGTRLSLRHEGIRQESARSGVGTGWNRSMARLGTLLNA